MAALNADEPAQTVQRQHVLGRVVYSRSRAATVLRRAVAILAIVLGLAHLKVPVESLLPQHIHRKDLLQEYTLARAIADGIDPYVPISVLAERYTGIIPNMPVPHPTPHPITAGLLLLPLSLLDYSTAVVVWFGLEMVCLVGVVYLLGRALGARLSVWGTLGIAAVLLVWHPVWVELAWGQLMLPMLALLAGAWLALRSGRPALGGALVGLAILLKPVALPLVLLFLVRKDWRALAGSTVVVFAGYLVAGCAVGLGTINRYFSTVLPLVASIYRASWANISISSLAWRVFDGTGLSITDQIVAPPLRKCTACARLASPGLSGLLLLTACLAVRKQRSLDVSFGVMVCVSILTVPISWPYYLLLALIPAAQLIRWLLSHRLPSRETNLALIVTMLLMFDWVHLATFLALRVARSLALRAAVVEGVTVLPFALAQLPLMTGVAVGALGWLVAWLGPIDSQMEKFV